MDYLGSLEKMPVAVRLDYYLKDMNGLAFMQELKANQTWAAIPVIVVSNSANPEKVSNMLALGAKKYILKAEYRLDEIIAMIRDFISDDTPAAAVTPPSASPSTPGPAGSAPVS
jgi:CheY-like chemotaxis protein